MSVDLPSSTEPQVSTRNVESAETRSGAFMRKLCFVSPPRKRGSKGAARWLEAWRLNLDARFPGHDIDRTSDRRASSEVPLALLLFHRGGFVRIDQASLPFGSGGLAHLGNDVAERNGFRLDRARQRIATKRAEAHAPHCRLLARHERQAIVVDHDERARALNDGAKLGEIERHNRNVFRLHVFPNVEFGPVGEGEDAQRFAFANAGVEQSPEFGALVARVPGMGGRAKRKDALFRPALLLVSPRPAKGGVVAAAIEGLPERFGLHHLGVELRAGADRRNPTPHPILVDMDD